MFIPWWSIAMLGVVLAYLIISNVHLHKRVKHLENVVRRLEGVSEEDVKKQVREKMFKNINGAS